MRFKLPKYVTHKDNSRWCQPCLSPHTLSPNVDPVAAETLAATKLQAWWRGFRTRHRDPAVLRLKQELRDRRAEAHIRHLAEELSRYAISSSSVSMKNLTFFSGGRRIVFFLI